MLKFLLGAVVFLWITAGDNLVGRALVVGTCLAIYGLVRWARR